MKPGEFDVVVGKLQFKTRNSKDRLAWLEYEGRIVIRTKRSHGRSGSGDIPCGNKIRQQLKLDETQLRKCIACTFGYPEYLEVLRAKGLIT